MSQQTHSTGPCAEPHGNQVTGPILLDEAIPVGALVTMTCLFQTATKHTIEIKDSNSVLYLTGTGTDPNIEIARGAGSEDHTFNANGSPIHLTYSGTNKNTYVVSKSTSSKFGGVVVLQFEDDTKVDCDYNDSVVVITWTTFTK